MEHGLVDKYYDLKAELIEVLGQLSAAHGLNYSLDGADRKGERLQLKISFAIADQNDPGKVIDRKSRYVYNLQVLEARLKRQFLGKYVNVRTRTGEKSSMQIVGATERYSKRPFIVEDPKGRIWRVEKTLVLEQVK